MKSNFNDCLTRVLKDEGGYSNTPGDNGGPTKYGITIVDVRKYVKKNATAQDVRNLSLVEASNIYKSKYWDTLSCDDLSSGVDYTCFDYGVNSGLGRPRKALSRFKSVTGTDLIDAINNERTGFLKALAASQAHDKQFLKGWIARVERVRSYSKVLAVKKNTTAGPVVGAATISMGTLMSQYWHAHEYLILGGGVALAIAVGIAIHYLINKGK